MRAIMRLGKKGKLSLRFAGPFEVLEKIRPIAYRVALPLTLSRIHNVFHLPSWRKYIPNLSHGLGMEC